MRAVRRYCRLRFSLPALLLFTAAVAAWLASERNSVRERQQMMDALLAERWIAVVSADMHPNLVRRWLGDRHYDRIYSPGIDGDLHPVQQTFPEAKVDCCGNNVFFDHEVGNRLLLKSAR